LLLLPYTKRMAEKPSSEAKSRWREVALYLIAIALCIWTTERVFKLRRADLSVPFVYFGDAVYYQTVIKGILTNGWYLHNDALGMPKGMDLHDFPMPEFFNFLLIKLLGYFTADHARVLNLFFLLMFPLTMLTSLYVLRRFKLSTLPALFGSLLYTFTNYHIRRNENHLMYAAYYMVPLMVLVLLWLCSGELSLTKIVNGQRRLDWRNPKLLCAGLICLLMASMGGAYYSFFALFLLLNAGLWRVVREKNWRALFLPVLLVLLVLTGFSATLLPNLRYRLQHGTVTVAQRGPAEAEMFGLKIAQMLLPIAEHRLAPLDEFRKKYDKAPLTNENTDAALGFIGGFGFLFLLGWLLYRRPAREARARTRHVELFEHLSVLNLAALLLGTIGGFGSLVAVLVTPQIRSYNRISIYISFFALFAVALLLEQLAQRYFQTGWRRVLFGVLVLSLAMLGVLDQTHKHPLPDYAVVKAEYQNDAEFFQRVEASAPARSMIFQLPAHVFPEGESYDHFKAYLHTRNLRWSYGAMKERPASLWQNEIAALPLAQMVEALATVGFCGLFNDRWLYKTGGAELEAELSKLLATQPLASGDNRFSYFDLTEYQRKLKASFSESEWRARQERLSNLILNYWRGEFSGLEGVPGNNWRWCGSDGELQIENSLARPRRVQIEMSISAANPGTLRIASPFFAETLPVNNQPQPFAKSFELAPGKHSIYFNCDAAPAQSEIDRRELVFRVNNFKLIEQE
jgi:phosphoglycerol transferase